MTDYNLHMGSGMILVGVGVAIEVISTMVGNVTYQKIGIVPIMMGLILFLYGLEMSRK